MLVPFHFKYIICFVPFALARYFAIDAFLVLGPFVCSYKRLCYVSGTSCAFFRVWKFPGEIPPTIIIRMISRFRNPWGGSRQLGTQALCISIDVAAVAVVGANRRHLQVMPACDRCLAVVASTWKTFRNLVALFFVCRCPLGGAGKSFIHESYLSNHECSRDNVLLQSPFASTHLGISGYLLCSCLRCCFFLLQVAPL